MVMNNDTTVAHSFSLNALQQLDNFVSVEVNLQELFNFTYQFPGSSGCINSHLTDRELDTMVGLCGGIDECLNKILSLRNQQDADTNPNACPTTQTSSDDASPHPPQRRIFHPAVAADTPTPPSTSSSHKSGILKKRRRRSKQRFCDYCNTDTTPQWRVDPCGKRTLCNVCGLMVAKRARRRGEDDLRETSRRLSRC